MTLLEKMEANNARRELQLASQRNEDLEWRRETERSLNKRFWSGMAITAAVTITASLIVNAPLWITRWQEQSNSPSAQMQQPAVKNLP